MPVSEFQRRLLLTLKKHRNPNSYIAGGVAIHREESSSRQSNDIDFFHDTDEAVVSCSTSDIGALRSEGYAVSISINQPSFVRAVISRGQETMKLEWVRDTAFRFFPVIEDDLLGYRLHDVDLAANKCLALANRIEIRDIIDLIQLQETVLSVAASCWAACGKDPGFTPKMMLDCMRRNSIIDPQQLAAESLVHPIDPVELKRKWREILDAAEDQIASLPSADLGCIYLSSKGDVLRTPTIKNIMNAQRHFGSVGGSWPRVV
ncbi:MAG: hypothetical protein K1X79_10490 [Oligoflexia bacterium]|nr:hypothetical protein [Oligoflexia bacterium]